MGTTLVPALLIAGLAFVGVRTSAAGEFYRWVDQNGVVHFSNVPNDDRYTPWLKLEWAQITRHYLADLL